VRVVSGKFEKGMKVKVARSGRVVSLSRPSQMFARTWLSLTLETPGCNTVSSSCTAAVAQPADKLGER